MTQSYDMTTATRDAHEEHVSFLLIDVVSNQKHIMTRVEYLANNTHNIIIWFCFSQFVLLGLNVFFSAWSHSIYRFTSISSIFYSSLFAMLCVSTTDSDVGGWGAWSDWTPCSTTCAGGTKNRYRVCDSPPPRYGAKFCEVSAILFLHLLRLSRFLYMYIHMVVVIFAPFLRGNPPFCWDSRQNVSIHIHNVAFAVERWRRTWQRIKNWIDRWMPWKAVFHRIKTLYFSHSRATLNENPINWRQTLRLWVVSLKCLRSVPRGGGWQITRDGGNLSKIDYVNSVSYFAMTIYS